MKEFLEAIKSLLQRLPEWGGAGAARAASAVRRARHRLLLLLAGGIAALALYRYPPMVTIPPGQVGVRTNQLTGSTNVLGEGSVLDLPLLHAMRQINLRDQVLHPVDGRLAAGPSPYQSLEGLSLGVDVTVRYAVDPAQAARIARTLAPDLGGDVVAPQLQGITYRTFARYTVREIFSSKREEIQKSIEDELRPHLASDGIALKAVHIGNVDLPPDYRHGMDQLLTEELEDEKMRYTIALKEKQIQQTAFEAQADKVRRETAAAAAAREQIIAAKAQEEAMKHVIPFKQKQIQQRSLEAQAEKAARIKLAEGAAQARRIEAEGEADSRVKLADAEIYRMDRIGKTNAEQMAREGELLSRHPLLIQKTIADKLSDKVRVIIAPAGTDGRFIGSGLVGDPPPAATPALAGAGAQ